MERTTDQIKQDIIEQLKWDNRVKHDEIYVDVDQNMVILSGHVTSFLERQAAEMDARAMPGVVSIDNRLVVSRPKGIKPLPDEEIRWDAESVLKINSVIDDSKIEVSVSSGTVILNGTVDAYWKKERAEELVFEVPGVYDVVNTLSVVPTHMPFDEQVAADIKSAIQRTGNIDLSNVTIEVNGGRVVVHGRVRDWQSYATVHNAAKYTRGVVDLTNELMIGR